MLRFSIFFLISFSLLQGDPYPEKFEGCFSAWKDKKHELLRLFLGESPVILQAGAHYGNETRELAKTFPRSTIYAFEPNPHAFSLLLENTAHLPHVFSHPLALNKTSGKAPFYVCHGSSGIEPIYEHASSLLEPAECMKIHYRGPKIEVDCITLDEWNEKIDLLYLNVQGAELAVLQSGLNVLHHAHAIQVHTNLFPFRKGITSYPELRAFLENAGFQLLAHWYREGLEGDAIFLKKEQKTLSPFLYRRYYEPFFKVYYDLDDCIDTIKDTLKKGVPYEGNIGLLIDELVEPGSLAIDVGAHIGVHTVTMSRKVGERGAVFAFEPNQKLYNELQNTLMINGCKNVLAVQKALAEKEGTVLLNNIQIDEVGDPVQTIALDAYRLQNVSLMKVDVECYEYHVLKGAEKTIRRCQPIIIFECWIGKNLENSLPRERENFERILAFFESLDYEVCVIYSNDFIAFPKSNPQKGFSKVDLNNFNLGI